MKCDTWLRTPELARIYKKCTQCIFMSKLKSSRRPRQSWILEWIPCRGFRIQGTGFQLFSVELGPCIPIFSGIPDSSSCTPDSKAQDSGFQDFWFLEIWVTTTTIKKTKFLAIFFSRTSHWSLWSIYEPSSRYQIMKTQKSVENIGLSTRSCLNMNYCLAVVLLRKTNN